MRTPLVAGNWKMNGTRSSVSDLLDGIVGGDDAAGVEIAVCAPAVFIPQVSERLAGTDIRWGGQDLSVHAAGAYTGEISAAMLREFGCHYVIVGHSERRSYHGESDRLVAEKFLAACDAGLKPIFCLGETLEEREKGATEGIVARQLEAVFDVCGPQKLGAGVIAYEPVWAIGTGRTATPEQAQEVHAFIRGRIAQRAPDVASSVRILYGGSMKPGNAAELIGQEDIDGGLIGGASLAAGDFLAICHAGRG